MKYRKNSKWHTLSFMGIEKCVCARRRAIRRIADDAAEGTSRTAKAAFSGIRIAEPALVRLFRPHSELFA